MKLKLVLYLVFVVGLTSCMSIKYTDIEVLVPSEVVYPPTVQNVLLVNNAAPQPSNVGHTDYVNAIYRRGEPLIKLEQDTVPLDSTGFVCLYNTANQIKQANFFQNVLVCPDALNNSPYYYMDQRLTYSKIQDLLEEYNADLVVSLDQLNYASKLTVRELYKGYYDYATLDVNFTAVWRIYYGNGSQKTQRVVVQDTIFWESVRDDEFLKLLPKTEAVTEGLWVAGEMSGKKLVPHWDNVQRLYYNGGNTYFKLADKYYQEGNWQEAENMWEYIYLSYKHQKKARAAVNLAYINELKGDIDKSIQWIDKALFAYRESSYSYNDEYKMMVHYKNILKKRKADEDVLIRQFEGD